MQRWQASEQADGTWRRTVSERGGDSGSSYCHCWQTDTSDDWSLERLTSEIRTATAEC